jgi:16S rRNA (guanine527-N7)-methyltransferase
LADHPAPRSDRPLRRGLQALDLDLNDRARGRLLDYVALLIKWNRVYNLTSVRKPEEIVVRHLLDSLAVAPHLRGERVLDVGTGAGLPGIPLAIALPDIRFVLLDSNGKKTRFVRQAVAELDLANVEVTQARVEEYRPQEPFDVVISRAFSCLDELHRQALRLLKPGGRSLAMKGVYPLAEIEALSPEFGEAEVVRLEVPGLDAERHLVMLGA